MSHSTVTESPDNGENAGPVGPGGRGEQLEQTRRALAAMLIPLFFVTAFSLCIIGTYHKPHPHDIRIGVVGPAAQTAALRAAIAQKTGSAFQVSPVTTSQGAQLTVHDVRPLAAGDPIGIGVFLFMVVCTVCGYLAVTLLFTVAPTLAPSRRYPIIVAVSLVVPLIAYLIGGLGFGTYTGSFGTISALIGVGALYTFVIGMVTRLLQVLLGPPALFVSLALFVFLNIPSLGATYTTAVLPGFWRFVNGFWVGAETTNAERSLLYFGGLGVGKDILRLTAWACVIIAILLVPVAVRLTRGGRSARTGAVSGTPTEFAAHH